MKNNGFNQSELGDSQVNEKMAMSPKGVRTLIIGLVVIVSGLILLSGGGSDDPNVFNWEMFSFTRMVVAPILLVAGIVIEIVAIMGKVRHK